MADECLFVDLYSETVPRLEMQEATCAAYFWSAAVPLLWVLMQKLEITATPVAQSQELVTDTSVIFIVYSL